MVPYYLLIGVPAVLFAVMCAKGTKPLQRDRITVDCFFLIFLLLLFFRAESVGCDLRVYKMHFNTYAKLSVNEIFAGIFAGTFEAGYVLICHLVNLVSGDFRLVMMVCAVIALLPVWYFYRREEYFGFLLIVLFANIAPFPMYFSGLRQAMAMAFAIPAYYACRQRKVPQFLLCVFGAFLFHRSALILLLMYPVYHAKLKKPSRFFLLLLPMSLVYIFRKRIFSFLIAFVGDKYYSRYGEGIRETGGYMVLLLLFVLLLMAFMLPDQRQMDADDIGLRNLLMLAAALQIFAGVHSIAMRMNYYFLLFIPVAVSRCLKKTNENRKIAYIAAILLAGFFAIYFFYHAYTDKDILQVFPYISMFSKGT